MGRWPPSRSTERTCSSSSTPTRARSSTKLKVPAEPYGIVANKDGTLAYVTHEYPGTVSEIDLKERKVLREIKAGAIVRGIALSPDEKRLYVTEFYTAALHAIDLSEGKVVDTWKGHSTDNLAAMSSFIRGGPRRT